MRRSDLIRASIDRVSPDDRIQRGLLASSTSGPATRLRPKPPWQGYGFRWRGTRQPKLAHWWAFPVAPDTHRLDPGARAIFEAVRDDPTIRKVVLTRSRRFDLVGENVDGPPDHLARRSGCSWRAAARSSSTGRRAPPSTSRSSKTTHHYVHLGGGLPIGPTGRCR